MYFLLLLAITLPFISFRMLLYETYVPNLLVVDTIPWFLITAVPTAYTSLALLLYKNNFSNQKS